MVNIQQKMTKINKLVMHGFKSFAKRTEIVMDDKFNCILGPNGSGKSNVLDALCFVLGKASAKGLRAEKAANLIYNGGKTKNPAKAGKVSIYFDNTNKIFPLDSKEIKITRIITQSGQSKYRINDIKCTRQQVVELLNFAKIDPDGYNIILQGDIITFIEMTPTEKRQVIEEISGISVYEEKKDKALKELDKVEKKLSDAEIIIKERKTHLRELKKDRDQALKYKELNDKIKENRASYLKIQIDRKDKVLQGHDSKITKAKEDLDKKQKNIADLKNEVKEKKAEIEDITKKVEKQGESENIKIQKEIESLRVDIATNKTRISSCDNEILRIEQKRNQLSNNLSEVDGKMEELHEKRKKVEKEKKALEKEKSELEKKVKDFKKKHKIEDDTSEIDKTIEELDNKSEELQKNIQELREKQQDLLREKDKTEFQIESIDEKISKVKEIRKEHEKEIEGLSKKKDSFKKATLSLNECLDRSSSLAAEIAKFESGLYRDKERLAKLRIRETEKKEQTHASLAVRRIIDNKNKFGKVFGTVSELGNVSSKYALAVEVAAGPRAKSIVVESDSIAEKCIQFLRQNKFGIATFLPLNKIKGHTISDSMRSFKKKPGAIGFAVDLVSFDSKFKDVFSYVFKDTLVVDTLANARRIGVGTVRMVTLEGDVIEQSGAMQGGFRQKVSSSFKEKEMNTEIDEIEARVAEASSKLSNLERERKENESKIIKLREEKSILEGEIIRVEKTLHLKSDDLDASNINKANLKKRLESLDKESDEIASRVSNVNRDLAQIKIKKQELKSKLSLVRNPTVLAELNTFDQRMAEIKDEIIKADSDIRSIDTQLNDIFKRDKENTIKIINDLDKEEKGFNEEIGLLKKKIKEQNSELKQKEETQAKFYAKFKTLFAKRTKLNEEVNKKEDKINSIDLESRKDEYAINTISLEIAKVRAELAGLKEDFSQYEGVKLNLKKSEEDLKKEIREFEKMKDNIGSVNMRALEIYEKVEQEYSSLVEKQKSLYREKDDVLKMMQQIESRKKVLFNKTFEVVDKNFQEIFTKLSSKGNAYLELENKEEPFEGGLYIKVRLTGKRYMDIRSLSGGEKTMTALAFIFAVQEHEPASFYVLDEVDAALDKHNSEKFAKLLARYATNSQYVIISHNDMVISYANSLYGVSMDNHGITKVVSLKI